jgi:PAS domain S-box-containing protein
MIEPGSDNLTALLKEVDRLAGVLLLVLFFWPGALGAAPAGTGLDKKNVLILHTASYETASSLVMDPVFVKQFVEAGLDANNLHFEFLDLVKHPDRAYRRELAGYLGGKYKKRSIDVIITLHVTCLNFLMEEGSELFPGVPTINVIADPNFLRDSEVRTGQIREMQRLRRPFVLLPFSADADSTVRNILDLRPDTRSLVVVGGSDAVDIALEQAVRHDLERWQGKLQIEYWQGLPLEQVLDRVAALGPRTAVLFTVFGSDSTGRTYRTPDVARRISGAAKVPVFGLFDTLLGNGGIVGGIMPTHGSEADRAVRLALEILRGKLPAAPVTISPAPKSAVFDWQQLGRWGLKASALPAGSVVLNRPVSVWEKYGLLIAGVLAFILGETLLIAILIVQESRRKGAEKSVRESETRFRSLTELSPFGISIVARDHMLYMNRAFQKRSGYDEREMISLPIWELIHPGDRESVMERARSRLRGENVPNLYEYRTVSKDGETRWMQAASTPIDYGNEKAIMIISLDITDRKRTEEELQRNAAMLRAILAASPVGIGFNTGSRQVVWANERLQAISGYSLEEASGGSARRLYQSDEEFNRVGEMIQDEARSGSGLIETKWVRKDGEVRDVRVRAAWVNPEDAADGIVLVAEDITEHKQATEAVRKSEERFRQVAENVTDFIWEVDAEGLYRYTSPSVQKILGYSPDEMNKKMHFYDLFVPEERERLKAVALQCFSDRRVFRAFRSANMSKDGNVVHLETSGTPMMDEAGNLTGYRGADTDVTERTEMAVRLALAAEEWQATFDSVKDMVMILDKKLVIRRANAATLSTLGLTAEEVCGQRYHTLLLGAESPPSDCPAVTALGTGRYGETELYREKRDVWLEVSAAPITKQEEVTRIVLTVRDITRRKKAEEGLIHHSKNLELLSEAAMGFVALAPDRDIYRFIAEKLQQLAPEAIYIGVNAYYQQTNEVRVRAIFMRDEVKQAFSQIFHADLEQVAFELSEEARLDLLGGKLVQVPSVHELLFGQVPKPACEAFEGAVGTGEILSMGFSIQGELYGNSVFVMPKGLRLGNPDVVETFVREAGVALRRRFAEEALRESEGRLNLALTATETGVWEWDIARNVVFWSPECHRFLSDIADSCDTFDLFTSILLPADRGPMQAAVKEAIATGNIYTAEFRIQRKDGQERWLSSVGRSSYNDQGEPLRLIGIVRDITKQKQVETEAFNANKELLHMERLSRMGELTASLAHELNQPLTSVLGNARAAAHFLEAPTFNLPEVREILNDIGNEARRAGNIIRSLTAMVKTEEAGQRITSINQVLTEAVSLFHSEAIMRKIRVATRFSDGLRPVCVDKVQIQQVVINLIMNAAESMEYVAPEEREIIVATRPKGDLVEVSVTDFGPGVKGEALKRMFQPFFTTKRSGLGIGLSLSRTIIESHGGHIWVENNAGRGTTFYFDLPTIVPDDAGNAEIRDG